MRAKEKYNMRFNSSLGILKLNGGTAKSIVDYLFQFLIRYSKTVIS